MRFIGLALAFASFSAMACPNLSGSYARCVSASGQGNTTDSVVTQSATGGVTTYTVTETDDESGERSTTQVVADGVARTETDTSGDFPVTSVTTTSCQGDALVINVVMSVSGTDIGNIDMNSQRSGNVLTHVMSGSIMGQEISDTIVCQ